MPKGNINWFAIGIIALLVYAFVPAVNTAVNGIFGAAPGAPAAAPQAVAPAVDFCADPSVTMTIGPLSKMYAPTTSVAGEFARVFVEGADKGLKADSTTLGVSWKDKVEIYYAENSSVYYAAKSAFAVPCKSTIDTKTYDGDADKLYQLDASTNLNFKFYNEDDGLLNADNTANEEIAAGDIVSISGVIRGQYEDAYSPYGGIYATMKYNSTAYDDIDFKVDTAGFSVSDAATPTVRSNAASATGFALKTVKINKGLVSNEYLDYTLTIDAHDTNEPGNQSGTSGDIIIYFDDEDWFRNTDTGVMEFGPEDNDDAIVGDAVNTATLHVS